MRILITIFPAEAHAYPIVPLAWALQASGHEVRIATTPDIAKVVESAGLTAVPAGPPIKFATAEEEATDFPLDILVVDHDNPDDVEAITTKAGYMGFLVTRTYHPEAVPGGDPGPSPVADDLIALARSWRPDLVLWDQNNPLGMVAAKAIGAPHGRLVWGLDNILWLHRRVQELTGADALDIPVAAWLDTHLRAVGATYDDTAMTGQFTLDLLPPGVQVPVDVRRVPLRRVAYSGGSSLPDWLREPPEKPRVCFTLGVSNRSIYAKYSGISIAEIFDQIADLDIELVATLNSAQLAGVSKIPDNVRTVDFVPLKLLLPTCSAIVHHGAGGTTAAAIEHSLPQLIVPVPRWDEQFTSRHIPARGAGIVMSEQDFSAAALRENLRRLLDEPGFRQGAEDLHTDWLTMPSPVDTVRTLEQLTAQLR